MSSTNKTKPTTISVTDFVAAVPDSVMRADSQILIEMMTQITGQQPVMWGPSIIGFDSYHYRYESGCEGDMCIIGFSPRKAGLVLYLVDGVSKYVKELQRLGKHKSSKACLYVRRLSEVDHEVLSSILTQSYAYTKSHDGSMHRA